MVFLWNLYGMSPGCLYGISIGVRIYFYDMFTIFLKDSYAIPMGLLWDSCGISMGFPWDSDGVSVGLLWEIFAISVGF